MLIHLYAMLISIIIRFSLTDSTRAAATSACHSSAYMPAAFTAELSISVPTIHSPQNTIQGTCMVFNSILGQVDDNINLIIIMKLLWLLNAVRL